MITKLKHAGTTNTIGFHSSKYINTYLFYALATNTKIIFYLSYIFWISGLYGYFQTEVEIVISLNNYLGSALKRNQVSAVTFPSQIVFSLVFFVFCIRVSLSLDNGETLRKKIMKIWDISCWTSLGMWQEYKISCKN